MKNLLLISLLLFTSFMVPMGGVIAAEDTTVADTAEDRTTADSVAAPRTIEKLTVKLKNPLDSSISSIPAFFLAILDILLVFAIPFVVFFIIYAGFMYVTARGNPGKIEVAHKALLYALIGGMLIFGARAILVIIEGTINDAGLMGG